MEGKIYEMTQKEKKKKERKGKHVIKGNENVGETRGAKLLKCFERQPKNFRFYNMGHYNSSKVVEAASGYFTIKRMKYKIMGAT